MECALRCLVSDFTGFSQVPVGYEYVSDVISMVGACWYAVLRLGSPCYRLKYLVLLCKSAQTCTFELCFLNLSRVVHVKTVNYDEFVC